VKRQFFGFVKMQLISAGGIHIPDRVLVVSLVEGLDRYRNPNKIHKEHKQIHAHAVVQWLRHYATSPKVTGSRPGEVIFFLFYLYLSGRTRLWFTQPLTEMRTRNRKIMFLVSRVLPIVKTVWDP
jgi:hypothetical protein